MRVIDKLNCPADYVCNNCKNFHYKGAYICENKHDISYVIISLSYRPFIRTKNQGGYRKLWFKILCEDYKPK